MTATGIRIGAVTRNTVSHRVLFARRADSEQLKFVEVVNPRVLRPTLILGCDRTRATWLFVGIDSNQVRANVLKLKLGPQPEFDERDAGVSFDAGLNSSTSNRERQDYIESFQENVGAQKQT